jgi:magnesium-dependent phosphatase 1
MPERDDLQTNNVGWGANEASIGDSQENRDDWVKGYGVTKPYILFSKHYKMPGMPIPDNTRFNEMVIYPQLQDSLFFAHRMQRDEVEKDMQAWDRGWLGLQYDRSISSWGITVPYETRTDVASHGETLT